MGRLSRFVVPDVKRLDISDGDWIEIKKDLNTGDQKKLDACGMLPPVFTGGRVVTPIDWEVHDLERALIFLVAWSIRKADDKPAELTMESLKALEPETFEEINSKIVEYTLARAQEKNELRAQASKTMPKPEEPNSEATSGS